MKNLQKTVNKRAFEYIQKMKISSNMIDVENILINAVNSVFKTSNLGLLKIKLVREGRGDEYKFIMGKRFENQSKNLSEVLKYLFSFIPERFAKTIMYKNLQTQIFQ